MADEDPPGGFARSAFQRTDKLSDLSPAKQEVQLGAVLAEALFPRLHQRLGGDNRKFGNFDVIGRFGHIGGWLAVYQNDELLRLIESARRRLAPVPAATPPTAPADPALPGLPTPAASSAPAMLPDDPFAPPAAASAPPAATSAGAVASVPGPASSVAEWWQRHRAKAPEVLPWQDDGLPELVAERLAVGNLRDALLPVLSQSQNPRLSPRGLEEMLVEVLAIVRAGELRGESEAELVTDVLVLVLSRLRSTPLPDRYRHFILQLYGILWRDIALQATPGNVQSLATLGDVAGRIKLPALQRLSVAIYEACLRHIAGGLLGDGDDAWKRARIAANNISSHVSALAKFDSGIPADLAGDALNLAYLLSRLQAINTVGSALTAPLPDDLLDDADWALLGLQPQDAGAGSADLARALATIVRSMNNVLSSWIYPDPQVFGQLGEQHDGRNFTGEAFNLVLSTFGSLVRSRMADATGKDFDEASSSLFNSGLAVTRLRAGKGEQDQAWLSAAEMSYYAMGLVWALARGADLAESLGRLHGSSCLVNLLGSAARIESLAQQHEPVHAALSAVVVMAAQWSRAGFFDGADAGRIEASLSSLGKRYRAGRSAGVGDNAAAASLVQRLWAALVQALGLSNSQRPAPDIVSRFRDGYPLQFALLSEVLRRSGQSDLPTLSRQLRQVLNVLTGFVMDSGSALATLVALDAEGLTVVRRSLQALESGAAAGNRGSEWKADFAAITQLEAQGRDQDNASAHPYQAMLEAPGALQWLPGVQVSDRLL